MARHLLPTYNGAHQCFSPAATLFVWASSNSTLDNTGCFLILLSARNPFSCTCALQKSPPDLLTAPTGLHHSLLKPSHGSPSVLIAMEPTALHGWDLVLLLGSPQFTSLSVARGPGLLLQTPSFCPGPLCSTTSPSHMLSHP